MLRIEAVIIGAAEPAPREVLTRMVGCDCGLVRLTDGIRAELRDGALRVVRVAVDCLWTRSSGRSPLTPALRRHDRSPW
jgi:hypothetical protein